MITAIKENIKTLEQFEDRFQTAVRSQYARAITSKDYDILKEILVKAGKSVSGNGNCSRCQYNLLLELGKLYFEYKNEQATKATKDTPDPKGGTIQESDTKPDKGKRAGKR